MPPRSSHRRHGGWPRAGTGFLAPRYRPARLRRSSPGLRADGPDDVADGINRPMPAADYVGDKPGPAGLVGSADCRSVVTVEVLAENDVVPPRRVVLEPLGPAKAGPPAVRTAREDRDEPVLQVGGDLVQGQLNA